MALAARGRWNNVHIGGAAAVPGEDEKEAYQRGVAAGEIATRLREHDEHLKTINGSMARVADELSNVKLELRRLSDAGDSRESSATARDLARENTVKTTAAALESERQVRSQQSNDRWTPLQRLLAVMAAIGTLAGLGIAFYVAVRTH